MGKLTEGVTTCDILQVEPIAVGAGVDQCDIAFSWCDVLGTWIARDITTGVKFAENNQATGWWEAV